MTHHDSAESPHRVLVLTGRGRYEDPWHDHAATSHRLANLLGDLEVGGRGCDVEVRSTFPDALDDLDGVDLLVVNSGTSWPGFLEAGIGPDDGAWSSFHERLAAWARAGGSILALHQAANTFGDASDWEHVLGGRWVAGESYHPPSGPTELTLATGGHPLVVGAGTVEVEDERYCGLRVAPTSEVLGWVTDDDGEQQPVLWTTEEHGGRTLYSGLGHDVRAYDSPSYLRLLLRAGTWLLT
ncbi:ThuA domain-containing protein [Isoptericola aurantiacus]|uniref:ThuA domain-containing protein n=1 Tax=Isoptericola aurantiacus TaxID=3377839 RepID=UPI00383B1803